MLILIVISKPKSSFRWQENDKPIYCVSDFLAIILIILANMRVKRYINYCFIVFLPSCSFYVLVMQLHQWRLLLFALLIKLRYKQLLVGND